MPATKPLIEELARVDTGEKSLRVQRERQVEPDGEIRMRVSLVHYVRIRGDKWARHASIPIRRGEMRSIIEGLTKALSSEPIIEPKQGVLL
jgi:hypothetical protein